MTPNSENEICSPYLGLCRRRGGSYKSKLAMQKYSESPEKNPARARWLRGFSKRAVQGFQVTVAQELLGNQKSPHKQALRQREKDFGGKRANTLSYDIISCE